MTPDCSMLDHLRLSISRYAQRLRDSLQICDPGGHQVTFQTCRALHSLPPVCHRRTQLHSFARHIQTHLKTHSHDMNTIHNWTFSSARPPLLWQYLILLPLLILAVHHLIFLPPRHGHLLTPFARFMKRVHGECIRHHRNRRRLSLSLILSDGFLQKTNLGGRKIWIRFLAKKTRPRTPRIRKRTLDSVVGSIMLFVYTAIDSEQIPARRILWYSVMDCLGLIP